MPIKKSTSTAKTEEVAPKKKSTTKKAVSTEQAVKAKDEKAFDMEIPINKAIAGNMNNVKKGIPHVKVDSVEVDELKDEDEDVITSINTADSDGLSALEKDDDEELPADQTEETEETEELIEEVDVNEEKEDDTDNVEASVEEQDKVEDVERVVEKKAAVEKPLEEEVVEDNLEAESVEEDLEDSIKEGEVDEDINNQEESNDTEEEPEAEAESESVEVQHIGDKKAPVQKATPKLATLSDLKSFGSTDDDSDDEEYEEEDEEDEEGGVSGFFTQEFAFGMSRGVILAIFIVLVVVLGFLYQRNISDSGSTPSDGVIVPTLIPVEGTEDNTDITVTPASSAVDIPAILNEISEFLILPKETPTVAAIVDVEQLRVENPDFFANAENGDILIVYENKQIAFIYRSSERKVIDFQPVVNNGSVEGEETQITE